MNLPPRNLLDLPIEVLAHILSLSPACSICTAARACKVLYEASTWETVWRTKTEREFRITNLNIEKWTYRNIYQKLLYKYGHTLGLWQCDQTCYGAVLKVEFDADNACLRCDEILPPQSPYVENSVRRKALCVIKAEVPTEVRQISCCYRQENSAHHGTVTRRGISGFEFRCRVDESEHDDRDRAGLSFPHWIKEEYGGYTISEAIFQFGTEVRLKKFIATRRREHTFTASPFKYLNTCDTINNPVIEPGIFKGTYSVHGIEFVHLSYGNNDKLVVRKITGDENVPAGQITNMCDLTRPMVLNRDQQNADSLLDIDIPDMEPGFNLRALPRQPFVIPTGWYSRGMGTPEYCLARFHGRGQIAGSGFTQPTWTPGHWLLFDENTFGFLWLELNAFGLYSRVKKGEL